MQFVIKNGDEFDVMLLEEECPRVNELLELFGATRRDDARPLQLTQLLLFDG